MKTINVTLKFPSQFSKYIDYIKSIDFEGETIIDFIIYLDNTYGDIKQRLLEDNGELRPYINFFIGDKNIKTLDGLDAKIVDGDKISLLLSRAGG